MKLVSPTSTMSAYTWQKYFNITPCLYNRNFQIYSSQKFFSEEDVSITELINPKQKERLTS